MNLQEIITNNGALSLIIGSLIVTFLDIAIKIISHYKNKILVQEDDTQGDNTNDKE